MPIQTSQRSPYIPVTGVRGHCQEGQVYIPYPEKRSLVPERARFPQVDTNFLTLRLETKSKIIIQDLKKKKTT